MNQEILKQKLQEEKNRLENELKNFATQDKHMKDNWNAIYPSAERGNKDEEADDASEYDNALSIEESLEVKLRDVTSALEKMATGTYGNCERCGKNIEEERLMAYPEAKTCLKCND